MLRGLMKLNNATPAAIKDECQREAVRQSMRIAYAEAARVEDEYEGALTEVKYGLGEDNENPAVGVLVSTEDGSSELGWVYVGCGARMLRCEVDKAVERLKGAG